MDPKFSLLDNKNLYDELDNFYWIVYESSLDSDLIKIDQRKREFTIRNKYYPFIEQLLPKRQNILLRHIIEYRDANSEILTSPIPVQYPIFKDIDWQIVYKCTGIDEKELQEDILKIDVTGNGDSVKNFTPFRTVLILVMRYYYLNHKQKELDLIYRYYTYSIYWTIFSSFFQKFMPTEDIMSYVINSLTNKSDLKKAGSIDNWLYSDIKNKMDSFIEQKRLDRCSDLEIDYMIRGIHTKINNKFRKISNAYYEAVENKDRIYKGNNFYNEEGSIRDASSVTSDAEMLAQTYTSKFFTIPPSPKLITLSAKYTNISVDELRATIYVIFEQNRAKEVYDFYLALFYTYLSTPDSNANVDNVKSLKFTSVMSKIFKKGNSKDKNILKIKDLSTKWLEEGSSTFRTSSRDATRSCFRKAVFFYFVYSVSYNK